MLIKFCTTCKIKIDKNEYKRDKTVCKNRYIKKKTKNNNAIIHNQHLTSSRHELGASHQQPKVHRNSNNRSLIIKLSKCAKTYLINYLLFQKQKPFYQITISINQYPIIKAQTSDEIQSLENYENSTFVSDDMLLSKRASNIDLFFTWGRLSFSDIYYISQSYFTCRELFFVIILI